MFVRCERCRAVYLLPSSGAPEPVVACTRCGHVFVVDVPLTLLSVQGVLGGAAMPIDVPQGYVPLVRRVALPRGASAKAAPPAVASRSRAKASARPVARVAAPPSAGRTIAVVAATVVALAMVAAAGWKFAHRRPSLSTLPAAALQKLEAAARLVASDDDASLEAAVAGYASLAAQAPDQPVFVARRALATALLGASLKAEAADLSFDLTRLGREAFQVRDSEAPDKTERLALLTQAQADLRERLAPATARSDKLLREALDLARPIAEADELPEALEAMVVVHASRADDDRVKAVGARLPPEDAWVAYARGSAKLQGVISPAKAGEAVAALDATARAHPELWRLSWELGRAAMYARDLDRAEKLFRELVARNPAHGGAARGLTMVAQLRAAP